MTSEGQESDHANVSSSPVPPPLSVNYLRILLLDSDEQKVLMQRVQDRWDLPYLVFPWGFRDDVATCCRKFQVLLGYQTQQPLFIGIIELLGQVGCAHPRGYDSTTNVGYAKLLFVEPRVEVPELKSLPRGFEWKDLDFVSSIEHDSGYDSTTEFSFRPVISMLKGEPPIEELLPHPPFQPGWFHKSSEWLLSEVVRQEATPTNDPVQFRLSHASSIIAVDSTKGPFFLKGVAAGSYELQITTVAVKLFPKSTPEIIAVNENLQAFVSHAFHVRRIKQSDRITMVRTLAKVQKESVKHLDYLITASVPSFQLEEIEGILNGWTEDEAFASAIRARLPDFIELLPTLVDMLNELATYNLPMCLVHGDFAGRNVAFKRLEDGKEHLVMHDWQFGAVSHPFFEFHDYREDWGPALDMYLEMWKEYEPLGRAREALELSKLLGWLLKLRGTLDCIRKGEAPTRFGFSISEAFLVDCFDYMENRVKTWRKRRDAGVTA